MDAQVAFLFKHAAPERAIACMVSSNARLLRGGADRRGHARGGEVARDEELRDPNERPRRYSRGGYFLSFSCKERRCIPSRRAASEMLPPQSESTRLMCSHSARASEGALKSSAVP
jgi:hypothetical protein